MIRQISHSRGTLLRPGDCYPSAALADMSRASPAAFISGAGAMSLLISILITFVVIILVLYLINLLPLDGRAKQIAQVVVIIIGIISLLKYLAVF
jgi:hypothetical protein